MQEQIQTIQVDMIDYTTDSNHDDISDYYTKKLTSGELRYGTHAYVFGTYDENGEFYPATYEEVQDNDNFDGDYLKNGEEIQVDIDPLGHLYVKFQANPSNKDSDGDTYWDGEDLAPLSFYRNPVLLVHGRLDNSLGCFGLENSISNNESGNNRYDYSEEDILSYSSVINQTIYAQFDVAKEYSGSVGEMLVNNKYKPNKNLFVFNYLNKDVTYINAQVLKEYIENLILHKQNTNIEDDASFFFATKTDMQSKTVKLDIVGHSNGGLVSRYYIENYGGDYYVRKLITIDTPHYGSSLADWGSTDGGILSLSPLVCPMDFDLSDTSRLFTGNVNLYFNYKKMWLKIITLDSLISPILVNIDSELKYALNHQSPKLNGNQNISTKYYAIGGVDYGGNISEDSISVKFIRHTDSTDIFLKTLIETVKSLHDVDISKLSTNSGDNVINILTQFGLKVNENDQNTFSDILRLDKTSLVIYIGKDNKYNIMGSYWHNHTLQEKTTHKILIDYLCCEVD